MVRKLLVKKNASNVASIVVVNVAIIVAKTKDFGSATTFGSTS